MHFDDETLEDVINYHLCGRSYLDSPLTTSFRNHTVVSSRWRMRVVYHSASCYPLAGIVEDRAGVTSIFITFTAPNPWFIFSVSGWCTWHLASKF